MFTQWLKKWSTSNRIARKSIRTPRPARCRPGLETLEDRLVPAVLTVNSLQDLALDLTDTTVTLRDAIHAANNDLAVTPVGPAGSDADTIRFAPNLFSASGSLQILNANGCSCSAASPV